MMALAMAVGLALWVGMCVWGIRLGEQNNSRRYIVVTIVPDLSAWNAAVAQLGWTMARMGPAATKASEAVAAFGEALARSISRDEVDR